MNTPSQPVVSVVRRFAQSAERVFDAWLNPAFASKWLFATRDGEMVRAETDPRVGGMFTFTDRRNGTEIDHTGEYLEIERPHRLVFTFGVPAFSPEFDRVTVSISALEDGGCELTLTNEMSPEIAAEWGTRTQSGWFKILESLAATLGDARAAANREPGEFTSPGSIQFIRLLPGPIERVWAYLTDADKRAKWLAGGPIELKNGGGVELKFRHIDITPHETPPDRCKEVHYTGFSMIAKVTRCEPPRFLSFTWEGDTPELESEVVFELTPEGEDVRLVLTHRRLEASRSQLLNVSGGWDTHLTILSSILSGITPPPFWATHAGMEKFYTERLERRMPEAPVTA